ncbi:hypothetical protein Tdes44962_MAKER07252 [Teratosphaeria destructans]|uniref:Uncharacterized protein n=1 Tax=Teratosphaeria destructans TaxID=418781 RepID=A0A9W7T027_9PEZI|nr:hypothetical protein Tdes44962_MAKER07252 [Teratosphaeria destructans]
MSTLPHTTVNPTRETPSTSETATGGQASGNLYPKDSVPAADVGDQQSKIGQTGNQLKSNQPGSAEAAAEKLYEERIEDEYAKREGGA